MKTAEQWYSEYAESHQTSTNVIIHYICVPMIYFTIAGMLMSIDSSMLKGITTNHFLINWATILMIPIMFFYFRLSPMIFIKMLIFSIICLFLNQYIGQFYPLFYTSLILFVLAWIGQFYGHHVEGKKPSFFKDLQFLLIGPIWIMKKAIG